MTIVNRSDPYDVTWRDGEPIDNRTASALRWVEKRTGVPIRVVQGSYQARYGGGATASAHTHDQGGVVDISTAELTKRQRIRLVHGLKRAGFAAWYRHGPGWVGNEHVHAVLRKHRNLHPEAAAQERDYDNLLNGLMSRLRDRTWRPLIPRRWSHRQNKPVLSRR